MKSKFIVILLLLSSFASAQKFEDVVYLKNGSIIRGQIIENIPDQYVKIQVAGGSIWVFQKDDILRISHEIPVKYQKIYEEKSKGFYNSSMLGLIVGGYSYYYNPVSLSLQITNGYKWQNKLYAGFTTGFEFLKIPAMPLRLEGRWDIFDSRISPYLKFSSGYIFPLDGTHTEEWEYNYKGGFSFCPALGFRSYFSLNSGLDLHFGFLYEELYSKRFDTYLNTTIDRREIFNRIYFSIGFIFR